MTRETSESDRSILRRLAEKQAQIAALPIHKQTIEGWRRINDLEHHKPMVWINEIPWHEMDYEDELTLQTIDPFLRLHEQTLRRTIYQWEHMRADMVVEPIFHCPLVIDDTGFGIDEYVDIVKTDQTSDIYSRHFHAQIRSDADIEKIKDPVITHNVQASGENAQRLGDIFGDILPVHKRGIPGMWFAPWDWLIRLWGVQEAMTDLADRPDFVHRVMERLIAAYLSRLDQWENLNLLALNNNNVRIGSGGLGYSNDLPQPDYSPARVRARDLWGCATAQIFGAVSPRMHDEFALEYELRWLQRFGLTYYGCCDPLDTKIDMLKRVTNLRKISMSPWIDIDRAVKNVGDRYVFSLKPNPAVLAEDEWNPQKARDDLRQALEKTRGCIVEVILKDISTVRYHPQRLWEWAQMAAEVTAEYA